MPTVEERLRQAAADLKAELARVRIPDTPEKGRKGFGWMGPVFVAVALVVGLVWLAPFSGVDPESVATPTTSDQPTGQTSVPETTPATTAAPTTPPPTSGFEVSLPPEGPIFGEETGVLFLFDDGLSGLIAVDPDGRLSERSPVEGQRAGDEPYSMIRVGDKLVVGWAQIHAVDIATREAMSLGQATIFVPAAEPNRVWMIKYPGGRIGSGTPQVWQVDVASGEPLTEPAALPSDGFPEIGIEGGLALSTDTGLDLWDMASGQITHLGPGIVFDVNGEELAWCRVECTTLAITNTMTLESEEFDPPEGYDGFVAGRGAFRGPNQISPGGGYLAALVGPFDSNNAIWILDRETGNTTVVSDPATYVDYLAWTPDGDYLFATSWSYQQPATAVWRYQIATQEFRSVVLPFGGALSLVVVDDSVTDSYIGAEPGDLAQCVTRGGVPRSECAFGY